MAQDSPGQPRGDRYARVRQILDVAAGSAEPAYDGQGRFWNRSLPEFAATKLYGIAMVAKADTPGRGAASGLVRGLRGQWPFDGTQFPPLPWGGTPVAPPDIQLISDWIDAGLPELDAPAPAAPAAPVDDPNAHRERVGAIKARQDVEHLSDTELANLRGAVAELMALNAWPRDRRSYNAWAQLHGDECPHGWSIFLPWHRMYLWGFEHELQDIAPSVTLPYWDWSRSTPQQVQDGYIPEAFRCWVTDEMLSSLSGKVSAESIKALEAVEGTKFESIKRFWAAVGAIPESEEPAIVDALKVVNPLFSEKRWPGDFSSGAVDPRFDDHYPRPDDIDRIVAIDSWRDFGGGMDVDQSFGVVDMDPHNTMHLWIGGMPEGKAPGLMANNLTAAFDPIFWAHHANVDRIWALWQEHHPGVDPPDPGDVLPGVSSTVQDSLDFRKLGYEYAADTHLLLADGGEPAARLSTWAAGAVGTVLTRHRRAEVRLHRIRQPKRSFLVRVFLNAPDADVSTRMEGNRHYAGHFTLFGHGPCIGGPGHCDPRPRTRPFDTRPQQHNEPWDVRFDVTETVAALVAEDATDIDVTLVVVAPGGDDPQAQLHMDGVSLSFHD
jgi:tyrosinase